MGFVLPQSLLNDDEFITDLARFSENILTEKQVRQKYHLFDEETWTALNDDALVERIELEKTRRIRSGAAKREKAQLHVVAAPDVLSGILMDPKANAKHRIDSAKALDDLADNGPQRVAFEQDRVIIRIDLSADTRSKDPESAINPADVPVFEASVRPDPNPNDAKILDATSQPIPYQEEAVPSRRGPGRPPGSKNKPKTTDDKLIEHDSRTPGLPGFAV